MLRRIPVQRPDLSRYAKKVRYRCTAARRLFTMDELLTALEISENGSSPKDDYIRSNRAASRLSLAHKDAVWLLLSGLEIVHSLPRYATSGWILRVIGGGNSYEALSPASKIKQCSFMNGYWQGGSPGMTTSRH